MTIVRTTHLSSFLTIVFLLEAEKRHLSMTTLYGAFSLIRIALRNPADTRKNNPRVSGVEDRVLYTHEAVYG